MLKLIAEDAEYLDPAAAGGLKITPENTAQITVAEAFSGNKDWGGTHNIDSFGVAKAGSGFQIAQDFDLGASTLGDDAHYWKGSAPITDAKPGARERDGRRFGSCAEGRHGGRVQQSGEGDDRGQRHQVRRRQDDHRLRLPRGEEAHGGALRAPRAAWRRSPPATDGGATNCTGAKLDASGKCRTPNGAYAAAECCK